MWVIGWRRYILKYCIRKRIFSRNPHLSFRDKWKYMCVGIGEEQIIPVLHTIDYSENNVWFPLVVYFKIVIIRFFWNINYWSTKQRFSLWTVEAAC